MAIGRLRMTLLGVELMGLGSGCRGGDPSVPEPESPPGDSNEPSGFTRLRRQTQEESPGEPPLGFLHAPDRIRTCDLRLRRPTLYPAELRALESP